MTVLDFVGVIKRHTALVVVIPIAFAAICMGVGYMTPPVYHASAMVVSSDPSAMSSVVSSVVAESEKSEGVVAEVDMNASAKTITINVTGPDEQTVVEAANTIADRLIDAAVLQFDGFGSHRLQIDIVDGGDSIELAGEVRSSIDCRVSMYAQSAEKVSPNILKHGLFSLCASLFVVIFALLVINAVRGVINSSEQVEEVLGLRLFGEYGPSATHDATNRLLVALRIASDKGRYIAVIPVSHSEHAVLLKSSLSQASEASSVKVVFSDCATDNEFRSIVSKDCLIDPDRKDDALTLVFAPPVRESAEYALVAKSVGSAILLVGENETPVSMLRQAVSDLSFADVDLMGFALKVDDRKCVLRKGF